MKRNFTQQCIGWCPIALVRIPRNGTIALVRVPRTGTPTPHTRAGLSLHEMKHPLPSAHCLMHEGMQPGNPIPPDDIFDFSSAS